ncbi:MAG: hypothetical protein GC192_09380 [Bacteroidetes bacterium]|nr:hypothetical protein [Bacteroidota bacterium]
MILKTILLIAFAVILNAACHSDSAGVPIIIGSNNQGVSKDSVEISFSILPDKIKCCKDIECLNQEVKSVVEHKNIGKSDIITTIVLMFGLKRDGDNHIEIYKLNGEEVNCAREIDYDYIFDFSESRTIRQNEIIRDTIDLGVFYSFKQKGVFRVRFISNEFGVASNWDTLVVN